MHTSSAPRRTVLRPPTRRSAAAIAGCTSLALLLSACTTGNVSANGGGGASTDTIRSTMIANPSSLNPISSSGVPGTMANSLLYGTLLVQDDDHTFAGDLAETWDVSPDKGVFTLRDGATCADETPITPTVVKNSLEAFAAKSPNKELVFGPSTPRITADDEARTVTIELDTPWIDMAKGLTMPETGIICPAGLEDPEATAAGEVEGAFSGPYTLANFQPGVSVAFALRENGYTWPEYTEPLEGEPARTVSYAVNSDYNSIANGLISGEIDIATVLGEPMQRFADQESFTTERFTTATLFAVFNEREGKPFADEKVRRAAAGIIGQEAFVQASTNGLGEPSTSFVSDQVECANTDPSLLVPIDTDPAAINGVSLTQVGTQAVGKGAGNTYIAQVLEDAGADVDLRTVDNAALATELATKPDSWDMTVLNLVNISSTMYGGLSRFTGPTTEQGGRNSTGAMHEDVVGQVAEAMAETDPTARCAIYEDIQEQLFQEAHVIPLSDLPAQLTVAEGFSARVVNGIPSARTMRITD